MPRVPRGLRRPAAAFLLLLHLALVGGWVVHTVAMGSDPAASHVQSDDTHDGARPHDERDCQLCQTATAQVLPPTVVTVGVAAWLRTTGAPSLTTAVRPHGSASTTQPRAPPPSVA